jgi:hypothetical protein
MGTLISRVAHVFTESGNYLTVDRHLLFVCGGSVQPTHTSLRKQFLAYANTELPNFRVFLAESATKDIFEYHPPHFLNLAQFEEFIAAYSDCIVLFPESHGSLAEIGFFAAYPRIRAKLLVVNDLLLQSVDSFINNGPLALINIDSDFRPVIHLNRKRRPVDFSPIKQRLLRFPSQRRMRFTFASYNELLPVARIGVILEIARIFSPISIDGILFITEAIFGNANYEDMKHIISLTVAVEYLSRVGELSDLFVLHENSKPIFALRNPEEINRLRISVLDFYRQHFPDLYALLGTTGS